MNTKTKNITLLIAGIVGISILGLCVVMFQQYLPTTVIGAKGGRASIRQGDSFSLKLPATTAPSVKIELCSEGTTLGKCTTLLARASFKTPTMTIPRTAPLGKAVIKVTERNAQGKITTKILMKKAILVAQAKQKPKPTPTSLAVGPSNPSLDAGRSFELTMYAPGGGNLLSRKSVTPIDIKYEGDWTQSEKEYACKISKWKFDGNTISSDQWIQRDDGNYPPHYNVFCSAYLDLKKFPSDVHELEFITQTPGGKQISTKAKINLAND